MHTVLVLGGYGFFGSRICTTLAQSPSVRLLIGGRDRARGTLAVQKMNLGPAQFVQVDANDIDLAHRLAQLRVDTLINTAGPFQGQSYAVARAAIQSDLELFPPRYPTARSVTFHAGFASNKGHLLVWSLAGCVKAGLLPSALPFAAALKRLSHWIEPLVSDKGGMFVKLDGIGHAGEQKSLTWHVVATSNHGAHIPCGASIALSEKLASGQSLPHGAMPCMGLLTVDEYLAPLKGLDIWEVAP
jgi:hypothetical protein